MKQILLGAIEVELPGDNAGASGSRPKRSGVAGRSSDVQPVMQPVRVGGSQ